MVIFQCRVRFFLGYTQVNGSLGSDSESLETTTKTTHDILMSLFLPIAKIGMIENITRYVYFQLISFLRWFWCMHTLGGLFNDPSLQEKPQEPEEVISESSSEEVEVEPGKPGETVVPAQTLGIGGSSGTGEIWYLKESMEVINLCRGNADRYEFRGTSLEDSWSLMGLMDISCLFTPFDPSFPCIKAPWESLRNPIDIGSSSQLDCFFLLHSSGSPAFIPPDLFQTFQVFQTGTIESEPAQNQRVNVFGGELAKQSFQHMSTNKEHKTLISFGRQRQRDSTPPKPWGESSSQNLWRQMCGLAFCFFF